jgi:hypothetical protein
MDSITVARTLESSIGAELSPKLDTSLGIMPGVISGISVVDEGLEVEALVVGGMKKTWINSKSLDNRNYDVHK